MKRGERFILTAFDVLRRRMTSFMLIISLCLDQLFRLRAAMNINEKKCGLLLAESRRRRAASKSTDDVVLIKTVWISA
jgi:hypothetical protein